MVSWSRLSKWPSESIEDCVPEPDSSAQYFEVELNTGEVLYSDISGDYLFAGDMYATSLGGLTNLSASRGSNALDKIAVIPEDEMIVFTPDTVKASITVFTDVDSLLPRSAR